MSLDVYLESDTPMPKAASSGIFIREGGATKEITRAEWERRYPDREPTTFQDDADETNELYSRNITHNLGPMAKAAGIYQVLWRPEEIGLTHAHMLIEPLAAGFNRLRADPERFKLDNPSNGWGDYDGLVRFVADYLKACIEHPDAKVRACR